MIPTRISPGTSVAVNTASTPGAARAADVSISSMSARTWAVRWSAACSIPGTLMSSTYPRSPRANSADSYLAPREPIPPGSETVTGVPLATTSMASRIFTYPVQRHRCAPRWRAISSRCKSAPFLSICDFARITMPGIQKPHCKPPHAANASENDLRSDSSTPSKVTIVRPAALETGYWHETSALPSIMMVQHPH